VANAKYRKGADFERAFIAEWVMKGYYGFRSAGSHSPFDVILIPKQLGNVVCCQLKRYKRGDTKPKVPKELRTLEITEGITIWFVSKEDYKEKEIEVV